jgi:hypothetical protein
MPSRWADLPFWSQVMLFSRRRGLRPAQKPLQTDSVDLELRSALWSCFHELYLKTYRNPDPVGYGPAPLLGSNLADFFLALWLSFFKVPTDTLPHLEEAVGRLREHVLKGKWHDVYDFLEFTLGTVPKPVQDKLRKSWNFMLERENSGYRIVGMQVVAITNDAELTDVEQAAYSSTEGAQVHLQTAITLFSDRKNPDYRNSIKESISAVESICRSLTKNQGATLGAALNILQPRLGMHGALKSALSSLYGYTSDEHGIRHAMMEEPNLGSAEAKFMLVACSAFTNFLVAKAAAAELEL